MPNSLICRRVAHSFPRTAHLIPHLHCGLTRFLNRASLTRFPTSMPRLGPPAACSLPANGPEVAARCAADQGPGTVQASDHLPADQGALELGAEHLQHEAALPRGGIDRVAGHAKAPRASNVCTASSRCSNERASWSGLATARVSPRCRLRRRRAARIGHCGAARSSSTWWPGRGLSAFCSSALPPPRSRRGGPRRASLQQKELSRTTSLRTVPNGAGGLEAVDCGDGQDANPFRNLQATSCLLGPETAKLCVLAICGHAPRLWSPEGTQPV